MFTVELNRGNPYENAAKVNFTYRSFTLSFIGTHECQIDAMAMPIYVWTDDRNGEFVTNKSLCELLDKKCDEKYRAEMRAYCENEDCGYTVYGE